MKISVRHQLNIVMPGGVPRAVLHLLVTPKASPTQRIGEWTVEAPGFAEAAAFNDAFGNRAHLITLQKPEPNLVLTLSGVVETIDKHGIVGRPAGDPVPALYRRVTALTKPVAELLDTVRDTPREGRERLGLLHALMANVGTHFAGATAEGGDLPAHEESSPTPSLAGMSQSEGTDPSHQGAPAPRAPAADHTHAFIGICRALAIPARYVSGYYGGEGEEPAAFHAWAEAFDDSLGWIGFDCVHGVCPTDRHVRLAIGLDAAYATPVRSVPDSGSPELLALTVDAAQ